MKPRLLPSLVAALLFVGLAAPSAAQAYTQPIYELVAEGGTRSVPGVTCGPTCADWYVKEHRPYPNMPASGQLHDELQRMRQKTGLLQKLSTIGSKVIPAAGAATIGWSIGTALRPLFYGPEPLSNPHASLSMTYQPWDEGTVNGTYVLGPLWKLSLGGHHEVRVQTGTTTPCRTIDDTPLAAFEDRAGKVVRNNPWTSTINYERCPPGTATETLNFFARASKRDSMFSSSDPSAFGAAMTTTSPSTSSNFTTAAPTTAPELQTAVDNQLATGNYPVLQQYFTHLENPETSPDPTADPNAPKIVPDCSGLSFNACVQALQEAGFGNYVRESRSFETAEPMPQAQPAQVLGQSPAGGSSVAPATSIALDTNPNAGPEMPFLMPDVRGKSAADSDELLAPFALPAPEITELAEPNLNYGPSEITAQEPAPGARSRYSEAQPRLSRNPTSAPVPGGSGGSCGLVPPSSTLNLSPIAQLEPSSKFPFAFVAFLSGSLDGIGTESSRPNASFNAMGHTANLGFLSNFDGLVQVFRTAIAFLLWIGTAWFLYGRTIGRDT